MKSSSVFLTLVVALFMGFLATSCNNKAEKAKQSTTVSTFNLTTAKSEIVAANKEFMTLFNAGDSAGVANLYSQDGKFMMEGAPAISGINNIQSAMSGIISSGITAVDLRTIDVWGSENLVTEEGEYSLFVGDTLVDEGKYLVLWKKEDGKWHLFRDIFNSNMPAE